MINKILQKTLDDEILVGRNLWTYLEYDNLKLGVADKYLVISQLKDYDEKSWSSLWKHATLVLKQFGYIKEYIR